MSLESTSSPSSAGTHWPLVRLGECVEILDRVRVPVNLEERTRRVEGKPRQDLYPYYGATGQVGWIDDFIFDDVLVLLGEDGAPFLDAERDKAYMIRGKSWVNNHAHVLKARGGVALPRYLMHCLNVADYKTFVTGTTRLKLTQSRMRDIPVPLPPLAVQARIVQSVDYFLGQLSAGIDGIAMSRQLAKALSRSITDFAVNGFLTQEWRSHRPHMESAANSVEAALAEATRIGERRTAATSTPTGNLPQLPPTWAWTTLDALTVSGPQNGLYLPKSRYGTGIPILRIDDFQDGWSRDSASLRKVRASENETSKYALRQGDLVINRVNSMSHLGKNLHVQPRNLPAVFESNMMRLRLASGISSEYVSIYLRSTEGRSRLIENAKQAVNQASINQDDVLRTAVPLPPPSEQVEIVRRAEGWAIGLHSLAATLSAEQTRAGRLRQAILKHALSVERADASSVEKLAPVANDNVPSRALPTSGEIEGEAQ